MVAANQQIETYMVIDNGGSCSVLAHSVSVMLMTISERRIIFRQIKEIPVGMALGPFLLFFFLIYIQSNAKKSFHNSLVLNILKAK